MPEIKIEKSDFLYFINATKDYIKKSEGFLPEPLKESGSLLLKEIESYQELRALMQERKTYYDVYMKNREINPNLAGKAYQEYKRIKHELDKRKGEGQ